MKQLLSIVFSISCISLAFATKIETPSTTGEAPENADKALVAPRTIQIETKKIGDAVHWTPATVEVAPGEHVRFVFQHHLEGGFDFHGVSIPVLNIQEQVNRNKDVSKDVVIPKTLKEGEYPIHCYFHPKHVDAKLLVKSLKK